MAAEQKNDLEDTRERLLVTAAQVFGEVGFQAATVRGICAKAGVNVASVNYHFGDKLGLYTEVLKRSSGADQQERIRAAVAASGSPEEALRAFVRGMFEKLCGDDKGERVRLMAQELANPTPALDHVVNHVIRPQYEQLCKLLGGVIGHPADGDATRLCVHSLIGQITHYVHGNAVIARLWPELRWTPEQRIRIADHIVTFTVAGLQATATATPAKATNPAKRKQK